MERTRSVNTTKVQQQALQAVRERYERRVMNNIQRADYVEALVAELLGPEWTLSWKADYDWAPWDLRHRLGFHIEVKQGAARQAWDCDDCEKARTPRFDVAPRKGYYPAKGKWKPKPRRHADIYIFAWHPETKAERADHRAPEQWTFYVMATGALTPGDQRSIGLAYIETRVRCGKAWKATAESLAGAVDAVRRSLSGPPRLTD